MSDSNSIDQILFESSKGGTDYHALKEAQHKIRNFVHVNQGIASILLASDNITAQQKELLAMLEENSDLLKETIDCIFDSAESSLPH